MIFEKLSGSNNSGVPTSPYASGSSYWSYSSPSGGIVNTTTAVTIKSSSSGLRNYVTSIDFCTNGNLGAATELAIRDGSGGSVLWRSYIPSTGLLAGRSISFPCPLKSTTGNLLEVVTITATVTGSVYFNASGYSGA